MHVYTSSYWKEQAERARLPLHERLLREAEAEEHMAEQFSNCSWMGDEHPSIAHRRRAAELREAAYKLKMQAEAPQRRREAAEARRKQREQELQDAMHEDNDW